MAGESPRRGRIRPGAAAGRFELDRPVDITRLRHYPTGFVGRDQEIESLLGTASGKFKADAGRGASHQHDLALEAFHFPVPCGRSIGPSAPGGRAQSGVRVAGRRTVGNRIYDAERLVTIQ